MWAVPVVVMLPAGQGASSLTGVLVGPAVGPLAQGRLDEALGLAVGLWSVGAGELVRDAELGTGAGEVARAKRRAVVGQSFESGQFETDFKLVAGCVVRQIVVFALSDKFRLDQVESGA